MLDTLYWLIAMFIFLLIELATISLATVWFAAGAAAAALVATVTNNGYVQFAVFFIVSLATLFLFRPSIAKRFNKKTVPTNVDSLIGRRVIAANEGDDVSNEVLLDYANPNSDRYSSMLEQIRKQLNFTTLRYHRLDDLLESIGLESDKVCTYCWSGKE